MPKFTDKEIREKVAYWQKRLSLKDWRVDLHIVDELPGWHDGQTRWNADERISHVWISRKGEDTEFTIVHELIHSLLWYADHTGLNEPLIEQTVNAMTEALLERKSVMK